MDMKTRVTPNARPKPKAKAKPKLTLKLKPEPEAKLKPKLNRSLTRTETLPKPIPKLNRNLISTQPKPKPKLNRNLNLNLHPDPNRAALHSTLSRRTSSRALSIGLQDFHNRLPVEDGGRGGFGACGVEGGRTDMDPSIRYDVQQAISRFYTGRIGVRFLIEHHVSTLPPVRGVVYL